MDKMKRFAIPMTVGAAVLLGGLVPVANAATGPRDCDNNADLFCGALTKSEWVTKVTNGDGHNSLTSIQNIYFNEGRGITVAEFNSSDTVDGKVMRNGDVIVNGEVVATSSMSTGRSQKSGSVKSGSVWLSTEDVAYAAGVQSIDAFVNMEGGVFHWAIMKSCGNTVVATPKPTPTPTP
ncbi:MAG TPA: hypothetical protein VLF67_00900, partial [Candidatus Saccharimonas sp.]|nr:hypothetical protein [Candidatus Saccharimonas sp.]